MTDDPPGAPHRGSDRGPAHFERRLKEALLPDHVPALPGIDLAAAHLGSRREIASGGDWHDVVVRDDGSVVLVVGDVVGWGVVATVATAELRAVVHERLCTGGGIVEAMQAADAHTRCTDRITSATVALLDLDPGTGDGRYCTAGHPPPLVWDADRGARFLPVTGGTPLATAGSFPVADVHLDTGQVVVLCSDGLLDSPARDSATSTVELVGVLDGLARERFGGGGEEPVADGIACGVIEAVAAHALPVDDVTIVVGQRRDRARWLTVDVPAEPGAPRTCRDQLLTWLGPLRASGFDVAAAEHVADELVRNVVQHAYAGPRRSPAHVAAVRLEVEWTERGSLVIVVSDTGVWREPGPGGPDPGHGLALVAEMAETVDVFPGEDGSTVTARVALHRPTAILERRVAPEAGPAGPLRVHWDGASRVVRVTGAVDDDAAERLRILLVRSTAGRSQPATLELTGVTHLSAAAVKVLFDLVHAGQGPGVRVVAPPGSPAHLVLDRVGLLPLAVR